MKAEHQAIWQRAHPYLQTRKNDTHTLYCYYFAQQLVTIHRDADAEIVLPAILLHDVGWSTVPKDKQLLSFGPHMCYPELRRRHEQEGARIAREILTALGHEPAHITEIATIIDGHDTRKEALSLNDALVKDADKLWRYTPFGLDTISEWFDYTIPEQMALLEKWLQTRFYTKTAIHMARGLLAALIINLEPLRS